MASSAPKTSKKGATWAVGLGIGRARAVMGDRLRSKRGEAPPPPSGQKGKRALSAGHHGGAPVRWLALNKGAKTGPDFSRKVSNAASSDTHSSSAQSRIPLVM